MDITNISADSTYSYFSQKLPDDDVIIKRLYKNEEFPRNMKSRLKIDNYISVFTKIINRLKT